MYGLFGFADAPVKTENKPKVLNARDLNPKVKGQSQYVGRPTKFGNAHPIGFCKICKIPHNREEAIEAFRKDFESNPELQRQAKAELKGLHLICWCAPKACHADILLEFVNHD